MSEGTHRLNIVSGVLLNLGDNKAFVPNPTGIHSIGFPDMQTELHSINSRNEMTRIVVEKMRAYVLQNCPDAISMLEFYGDLSPERVTNEEILSESSWVVYSSGFRYDIVKKYWKSIREAFHDFDVAEVASFCDDIDTHAKRICNMSGFRNLRKAVWCIQNAHRIIELDSQRRATGGLRGYFVSVSRKKTCDLVKLAPTLVRELGFKGIGNTTIFHLMKNLGIDIFKPDIHVRRVLANLGLIQSENAAVPEICAAMLLLSSESGMRIVELDSLLFLYGQIGGDYVHPVQPRSGG